MIKINVIVKDKNWFKYIKNPEAYLSRKIKKIQTDKFFGKKRYQFSLLLSEAKEIKYLNKKFRKKNKTTDILSFPSQNKRELKTLTKSNLEIYLGDIIISYEYINRPKKINIYDFQRKTIKIFIHGFLHLIGFDHETAIEAQEMEALEANILRKLGVPNPYNV